MHSSLPVGLPVHDDVTGALNVYATATAAFDDAAVRLAEAFSGYAAVALGNAHLYDTKTSLAQQMHAAMQSRAVIEQAKGILMGSRGCSAEEAFTILRKLSQDSNRKLRDSWRPRWSATSSARGGRDRLSRPGRSAGRAR